MSDRPTCKELQATLNAVPQTDMSQAKPQYALAGCVDPQESQGPSGLVWAGGGVLVGAAVLAALWQFHVKRRSR